MTDTARDCPFCQTLANLSAVPPEDLVWEFPHSVLLLGTWQYYHGYCVLVARRHATELSGLPDDERRAFLEEMCRAARAIETAFSPLKMNYELLGNVVPHVHWHLVPRSAGDPARLKPVWLAVERAAADPAEHRRLRLGPVPPADTVRALRSALTSAS